VAQQRHETATDVDFTGGPGRTRTCNQTVMSDGRSSSFVDLTVGSSAFDRVCCVSVTSFLVRNWCGCRLTVRTVGHRPWATYHQRVCIRSRLNSGGLEDVGLLHCNLIPAGVPGSIPIALIANQLLEFPSTFIAAAICPWPALKGQSRSWAPIVNRGKMLGVFLVIPTQVPTITT
jgi:hypothetical protein